MIDISSFYVPLSRVIFVCKCYNCDFFFLFSSFLHVTGKEKYFKNVEKTVRGQKSF